MLKRVQHDKKGFTMAEILLSLTIIGVVAAITLPSLTGNINERTWNTQRKALYARFSQAIALMPALNGYGTLTEDASGSVTADTAAETFVTDGLSKVLKINNICDSDHLADCGIPEKIIGQNGSVLFGGSFPDNYKDFNPTAIALSYDNGVNYSQSYSQINTKAAAFETQNGESIAVYYNPSCQASMGETDYFLTPPKVCANFVYDLNGTKGPNTVGKDIGFMTVLYPTDSVVVAPMPAIAKGKGAEYSEASKVCRELGDEYRMPNKEEMVSLFINKNLINIPKDYYYTASLAPNGKPWTFIYHTAVLYPAPKSGANVKCINRY